MFYLQITFIFLFFLGCSHIQIPVEKKAQNVSYDQYQPTEDDILWCNQNVENINVLNSKQKQSIYYVVGLFKNYINRIDSLEDFYQRYLPEKNWPPYIKKGLVIHILKYNEKFTDIPEVHYLKSKKVKEVYVGYSDGPSGDRLMDDITGEGSHRMVVVKINRIPEGLHGANNGFYHEFAHLIHQSAFSEDQIYELERLYKNAKLKNLFLDDYAATNETEYFAVGFEAFLSKFKFDKSWIYYKHERQDLFNRDPMLFQFIENLPASIH